MKCDSELNDLIKQLLLPKPSSEIAKKLRKMLLIEGLTQAALLHGASLSEDERAHLLNQLDPEIFPL